MRQDDEATVKLENAAIERSKSVDSAVLGKYSIWRKENDNENTDSTVRLMRDQMIMARVYASIAKMKNKLDLQQELLARLKESQRSLGEASADSDLHHRYSKFLGYNVLERVLSPSFLPVLHINGSSTMLSF